MRMGVRKAVHLDYSVERGGGWLSEWLVHAPLVVQARARTPSVLPFALVSVDRPVRAPQDRDATQVQIVGRLSRALGSFSRGASW